MKQMIKTVGQIMEDLRVYTDWGFVGGVKGDTIMLKSILVNDIGKKIDLTLEIVEGDVLIKVTAWRDGLKREDVDQELEALEIPVEAEIQDSTLILCHHEPFGVLEHSVKGVLKQCIMPMVNVAAKLTEEE